MLTIGPYEVQRELARGGMGVVYLARGPGGEELAIKVLLEAGLVDIVLQRRFRREATALLALDHSGILKAHSFGFERGHPYLVMELLLGETLKERVVRRGPLPCDEVLALGRQMADALEYAHAHGVAHRDLKPANVILRGDAPVIVDFGLVRSLRGDYSRLTETGMVVGSPAFMAPEQAHGDPSAVGPETDVYGLGATLYYLLTGKPPFDGQGMVEVLTQVVSDPPVAPRRIRPDLDPALEEVVLRCLAKEPRARYQGAAALSRALAALTRSKPRVETRRRPSGLVFGLVVGVGVGCVVGLLYVATASSERQAEGAPAGRHGAEDSEPGKDDLADSGQARTLGPSEASLEADHARELVALERWSEAEASYSRALQHARTSTEAEAAECYEGRGVVRLELGLPKLALEDLLEAERLVPDTPHVLYTLSVALEWLGRDAEACEASTRAVNSDRGRRAPEIQAAALVVHSRLLRKLGDPDAAFRASTRAVDLTPNNPEAVLSRGQALYALGRMEEAVADCGAAQKLDPRFGPTYVEMARFNTRVDKLDSALANLNRALELGLREPLASEARAQRDLLARAIRLRGEGEALVRAGRTEQALVKFDDVLALLPRTAGVRVRRSELFTALRRYPEALGELEEAQQLEVDNPDLQYLRARALARVGRSREAANLFDEAVRRGLRPELAAIARRERDRLLEELGDR